MADQINAAEVSHCQAARRWLRMRNEQMCASENWQQGLRVKADGAWTRLGGNAPWVTIRPLLAKSI